MLRPAAKREVHEYGADLSEQQSDQSGFAMILQPMPDLLGGEAVPPLENKAAIEAERQKGEVEKHRKCRDIERDSQRGMLGRRFPQSLARKSAEAPENRRAARMNTVQRVDSKPARRPRRW